ncbi:unnamed protein product [Parnassius mnemosyne]|uniref:Uncharacterized protein n=1 Tax=Parnassius mnemosyne TaxID=213953 RepID=A0AAV1L3V4_9NEOP
MICTKRKSEPTIYIHMIHRCTWAFSHYLEDRIIDLLCTSVCASTGALYSLTLIVRWNGKPTPPERDQAQDQRAFRGTRVKRRRNTNNDDNKTS